MAFLKPKFRKPRWDAPFAATVVLSSLAFTLPSTSSELAQREAERRNLSVVEAMELLRKGDEAYLDTDYPSAVEAFAGAREMIPNVPASAEVYQAATERFATASVEHARVLSRQGDVAKAITVVKRVLAEGVAPQHPGALRMLAELQDPIRTNPALTIDHTADVDQVRRGLYTAEGAYNLGKFDEAERHYQAVLNIDPHNRAARRGMERVSSAKSAYQESAFDHTRAEMLGEVDAQWETQPPMVEDVPELETGRFLPGADDAFLPVSQKLSRIVLPVFRLEEATIQDAIQLLRVRARENDILETDPEKRGINIQLLTRAGDDAVNNELASRRINLQLSNVTVEAILGYICDATSTGFTTDDFSVIIRPRSIHRDEMLTRMFRVPPDFLSALSATTSSAEAPADIFSPAPQQGLLPRRVGIREALEANGVPFPEGAGASLSNNMLRVTHTGSALETIEQLVNSISETEPVMVVTRVTIIRVQESELKELGFDWLLGNFKLLDAGGGVLSLSGGTEGNGSSLADLAPISIGPMNPITAGNRSGDYALSTNSFLGGMIGNTRGDRAEIARAPGILSVTGVMNNTTAQMVIRGLDQNTGVDVMQQPSVVSSNGQASSIRVVREFMYPTEYEPPEIPQTINDNNGGQTPVTPSMPTAFETRDVGMKLEVLPLADAGRNYIDLTIAPEFTEFDGFLNYGTPINSISFNPLLGFPQTTPITSNDILMPIFSVQRLNTQVTIADGATLVLGGLLSSRVEDVEDKVPLLGDVPVVGRLFQSSVSRNVRTALIFFVNVELIDPAGRPYRDR
jgi:general secretion pathway protein D